jgi:hypothetical protein
LILYPRSGLSSLSGFCNKGEIEDNQFLVSWQSIQ